MSPWHLLQRYRQYTNHALWVVPFSAIILELVLYRLLRALDDMLGWQLQRFSASGAQAMLEAIITMALSFIVFTFGSLLVAIQVARRAAFCAVGSKSGPVLSYRHLERSAL